MELKVEIGFNDLLHAIKALPENQLSALKIELEKIEPSVTNNTNLKDILLKAPVFGKDELSKVKEARKQINKWRAK